MIMRNTLEQTAQESHKYKPQDFIPLLGVISYSRRTLKPENASQNYGSCMKRMAGLGVYNLLIMNIGFEITKHVAGWKSLIDYLN